MYVDGTSFSTAFMSGIIARLKELNPKISNKEIYIKLVEMTNASKWNETNGYGTPTFH
ncbi:S8 family serine peptidase [Peribacillus frigoritolerans]|uniref:S8 family serine peptidase n=1 Tax=Peribacillus frigoritolerans TaxID=450367 RepID=UPI0035580385